MGGRRGPAQGPSSCPQRACSAAGQGWAGCGTTGLRHSCRGRSRPPPAEGDRGSHRWRAAHVHSGFCSWCLAVRTGLRTAPRRTTGTPHNPAEFLELDQAQGETQDVGAQLAGGLSGGGALQLHAQLGASHRRYPQTRPALPPAPPGLSGHSASLALPSTEFFPLATIHVCPNSGKPVLGPWNRVSKQGRHQVQAGGGRAMILPRVRGQRTRPSLWSEAAHPICLTLTLGNKAAVRIGLRAGGHSPPWTLLLPPT